MQYEVHCPDCGQFFAVKSADKGCPRCQNRQAISLHRRYDIEQRFRQEKLHASG